MRPARPLLCSLRPPSLWTLETVSGSSQVVPTGQAFQPLVMRVTDGSAAANPVMGVNVTFATTLARVSENGMPVLLGSSQAQVVTRSGWPRFHRALCRKRGPVRCVYHGERGAIDRAAANGESGGDSCGPAEQQTGPGSDRAARYLLWSELCSESSQTSPPQSVPERLFAVPPGIASNDPAVDSHGSDCPDPCTVDVSGDRGDPTSSDPAGSEKSASPPPATLPPADATTPKKRAPPVGSDSAPIAPRSTDAPGPIDAPGPPKTPSAPASSSSLTDDKRSCRVLAGDGPIL